VAIVVKHFVDGVVVVYRTAALGDFILSIPALIRLRELFPCNKIILLTAVSGNSLQRSIVAEYSGRLGVEWVSLLPSGIIDETIYVESYKNVSEISRLRAYFTELSIKCVVCMVDVGNPYFNRLKKFTFLKAILPFTPIYGLGARGARFRRNEKKLRERGQLPHHVYGPMQFVEDMGLGEAQSQQVKFSIKVDDSDVEYVRTLLDKRPLEVMICISFGSTKPHKKWPIEKFRSLLRRLSENNSDLVFVLTGVPADRSDAQALMEGSGNVLNLAGRLSISQLAALFSLVPRLIGNDGGAVHLADALGAKVVAIVPGIEFENSIEPFHNQNLALRAKPECYPCYNFDYCTNGTHRCLTQIDVDLVLDRARFLFSA
jgi:heptosyltransferase II